VYVIGEDFSVPLTAFVPSQSPDASHDVAFVEVQDRETVFPLATVTGPSELFAFILTVGTGMQASFNKGSLIKDPHPFQSMHVFVCCLFAQLVQAVHSQFGVQSPLTV